MSFSNSAAYFLDKKYTLIKDPLHEVMSVGWSWLLQLNFINPKEPSVWKYVPDWTSKITKWMDTLESSSDSGWTFAESMTNDIPSNQGAETTGNFLRLHLFQMLHAAASVHTIHPVNCWQMWWVKLRSKKF